MHKTKNWLPVMVLNTYIILLILVIIIPQTASVVAKKGPVPGT